MVLKVMRMLLLKVAALLAFILFIAPTLVIGHAAKPKPRAPLQVSSTFDLNSLSVEDINRKTLEAADAMRVKQAERFLQRQH